MPPLATADAFLVVEFIAGNRRIPHAVFAALLGSLPSSPRISPRLRKALVLRALHAEEVSCSFTLLRKARRVLADPDAAACFPYQLPLADNEQDDGARAAVADLKRLLDHEWANLPPSTLELAADRLAGHRSLHAWAAADRANRAKLRLLVRESTEREILAKLMQDDNTNNANEADVAQQNDESGRAQEGTSEHQNELIRGAQDVQLPENSAPASKKRSLMERHPNASTYENSAPASKKRSLMERHPNASTYEWDGLDDSNDDGPVGKRVLPPFERKPHPSPTCAHKVRKKWIEMEEKTLLEGVAKYGRGNWKDIKMAYPDVFEDRSTVDLKDKFRNMERHMTSA